MSYSFLQCAYTDIEDAVINHNSTLSSPIDSFAESHILQSAHYRIICDEEMIGYCCIHNGTVLTQFFLIDAYRNVSQELFARAKKMECVQEALVATCDELFLSLAVDCSAEIKKQAYFFQYAGEIAIQSSRTVTYRQATIDDLKLIEEQSEDFFDDSLERQLRECEIYIGFEQQNPVAFGVFERGKILKNHVSIGMFTKPEFRRMNIAKMTLKFLISAALKSELRPIAGCWYYNHLSRKTLEAVGMISNTRYLRISLQ